MNLVLLLIIILISALFGAAATILILWLIFNHFSKSDYNKYSTDINDSPVPHIEQFQLPQALLEALETTDTPKKESCVALNLIFHFLFHELQNSEEVRNWFLKKLSSEFDELLTRSTTGKLIDKITIRELDLGSKFPTVTSVSIHDAKLHPIKKHIETLDLSLDLQYEGGFYLGTYAKLLLGANAIVSVKVTHLSGRARLRFTREPYSHWSFTFYSEPSLELDVDSQLQGRPIPQVTSIIINQIRKAVKKKHTIPQFKLRYKPFFQPPSHIYSSVREQGKGTVASTILTVSLIECSRLKEELLTGGVYCTLAVDEAPWVEIRQTDMTAIMTVDLLLKKQNAQALGVTFKGDAISNMVLVDYVDFGSVAHTAGLKKGDIVLLIQGIKIVSISHANKLLRSAGNMFTLRVERKRTLFHNNSENSQETEHDVPTGSKASSPPGSPSKLRRRILTDISQPPAQSETESSGSSNTSPSNSPAKKPIISPTLTAEEMLTGNLRKTSSAGLNLSGVQIYRTKENPLCPDVTFNESVTFHVTDNIKYFNLGVWTVQESGDGKDILLGHLSIPISQIIDKCNITGLGHYIKKWYLQEPCTSIKPHILNTHSGFEQGLCYGDVTLYFILKPEQEKSASNPTSATASVNSSPRASASLRGELELPVDQLRPDSPAREIPTPNTLLLNQEDNSVHDFVRTHFTRATQCDFCTKKIWLKDAVQCRTCRMTCHKKCVTKCQTSTSAVCVPVNDTELLQGPSPTKAPEIITTSVEADITLVDSTYQPQGTKRGLGGLLASVANAAHARGIKRAGSASNLAPPIDGSTSALSLGSPSSPRSLPHSPQHSPTVSRKTSIADASLFELPSELADLGDKTDDIRMEEALEVLLQRQYDNEDIMTIAKDTGRQLYSGLPGRKEKINKLISKLKIAMDRELQIQEALKEEAEDASDCAQRAYLLKNSETRVHAITVLLLHCCAGLQHIQDTEEEEEEKLTASNLMEAIETTEETTSMI